MRRIECAAEYGDRLGLVINAGHGLNYDNVAEVAAIPQIVELNIGHAIVSRAVFDGLAVAVSPDGSTLVAAGDNRTLYVLDEPTIGLDVVAKESVRSFLRETRELMGTTVILTTHDLGDIQQLCRRIIIIDKGVVLLDGLLE